MILGLVKEGFLEILDEHLGVFCVEVMVIVGALTLSFREFSACGAPTSYGERDPIASRRWLVVIANAFRSSFSPRRRRSDMIPTYEGQGT